VKTLKEKNGSVGKNSDLQSLITKQRDFFASGQTHSLDFRRQQLNVLLEAVAQNEKKLMDALAADLKKPAFESYIGEVGFVYDEVRYCLKNLDSWIRPKRVATPVMQWFGKSRIISEPKGVVLILGPWNYPFQLVISPLIGSIAAGNCSILKPSEMAPHTSAVVASLVSDAFDPCFVSVVEGGVNVSQALLEQRFDHIFYTGGGAIGKIVMRAAAENLTPVTLELGGKSPCIIDDETDLATTARRIIWGKFFNAGQTCVAPDYCLVSPGLKPKLLDEFGKVLRLFFGEDPSKSPDYGRIINLRHFQRLTGLMGEGKVVAGGTTDPSSFYISPTILDEIKAEHKIMQDEIFGPLLPVLDCENLNQAIDFVNQRPKPLALYFFSTNGVNQQKILSKISYGGGCINDTLVHLGNPRMPFGGIGDSGMGAYHGKYGFDTFSHKKSVIARSFVFDPSIRYPPYGDKLKIVKKLIHP
jgi:aldehyde dehydrogenase (NAD+)